VPVLRLARTFGFATLALSLCAPHAAAQQQVRPTRVLVLYQQQAETQSMVEFSQPLQRTIRQELGAPVDFYQESLDFDRFAGREQSPALADYLDEKYRRHGIDVVVPVGGRALRFAIDRLSHVLPKVPIVFALCAAPQTDTTSLPANVTGRISSPSRFTPTLWMARRLQPDAERIVVVSGGGKADSISVAAVVSAAAEFKDSLELDMLQGLSLSELLPRLRALPPRSIIIFANFRHNERGHAFEPLDLVGTFARAAAAPMYAQVGNYVGEGIVGGSVVRFDDEGARTGRLVVRVLRRHAGEPMPPMEPIVKSFVADWRQLRRFGLQEERLPPGTQLLFREPTAWERHQTVVLPTLAVIGAELLLIGSLLIERRRRIHAQLHAELQQQRVDETRRQVAHMGRVALLGELVGTMSHELRQPLAAMRANADTGVRLVRRQQSVFREEDRELYDEIFRAIADDDARASDIISRIRALVRREELPQQPVDLNEVCRTAARLLQYDALTRRTVLALSLDPGHPMVTGDPIQFQQVVLNLILNALEAAAASDAPRVEISTAVRGDDVEVAVRDNGPGLAADVRRHLFESFFTTKPQGLGLGLAIVHSIIERHNGRVQAENGALGGAIFSVVLPRTPKPRDEPSEAHLMHIGTETAMPS